MRTNTYAPEFRLVVTGGGTGGHVYPALTTVNTLRERLAAEGVAMQVLWVGQADSLEARVAQAEGIDFTSVAVGKIRRSSNPLKMLSPRNIRDMANVPIGVMQARKVLRRFRPDVVLATGGYVTVPVGLAARFNKVPLVIHEQTVRLGLANRLLAREGVRVAVSSEASLPLLPEAVRPSAVVTGNPVRREIFTGHPGRAAQALGFTGWESGLPTVYVTGGSTGAAQVNELMTQILPRLLPYANVIHQCGAGQFDELRQRPLNVPGELARRYHLTAFLGSELPDVLALADIVVARSGAGTVAELTALGKPAVFIPYPHAAGDEQAHNARHLAEQNAAVALLGEVTAERLLDAVGRLLSDAWARADMAGRAKAVGKPDAAHHLAGLVLTEARAGVGRSAR